MPRESKNTIHKVEVIFPTDLPPEENERRKEEAADVIWRVFSRAMKREGLLPEEFPEER